MVTFTLMITWKQVSNAGSPTLIPATADTHLKESSSGLLGWKKTLEIRSFKFFFVLFCIGTSWAALTLSREGGVKLTLIYLHKLKNLKAPILWFSPLKKKK